MFKFKKEQWIGIDSEKIWEFFSDPNNLGKIMPPEMGIEVKGIVAHRISAGQIIEYKVRVPILGRKKWVTEIKEISKTSFTDIQKVGPYKSWEHKHTVKAEREGTRLIDEIQYELPLGILGKIGNKWLVTRSLEKIFGYRMVAIGKLFGQEKSNLMGEND
ncbi:MAG: SRPBCC family protein [Opitutae bacterium]|jgi:ligand-binding SRPBCC domain-containing protein|nr:SRPBCC family protein [Opitutae bacterium]MBT5379319.1 SRPBCC family protein [Opitutae bacterium]MBT5690355.1 SRPBCC family protein [Opitutae bacterium]MBT6463710.1 SRPBCC family protein [Opitutae bacterium]MBT6957865.1 SRPBCC family protein [Opitutae bacterium]